MHFAADFFPGSHIKRIWVYFPLHDTRRKAVFARVGLKTYSVGPPPLSAKQAKHVGNEENHQDCPQSYTSPAAGAPAAMAVVSSTNAKDQQQNDDEYQHCRVFFLLVVSSPPPGRKLSCSFSACRQHRDTAKSRRCAPMGASGMLCVGSLQRRSLVHCAEMV